MRYLVYLMLPGLLVLSCSEPEKAVSKYHREMPCPQSDLINSFHWTSRPYKYPGTASDMHWWTWGIDDAVYTLEDDGQNFGGPYWYAHILKITGTPPNHRVETVTDFENYDFRQHIPKKLLLRYVCGLVAVDSALYVCLYDYDWNIAPKPAPFDSLYKRMKRHDPWMNVDSSLRVNVSFINKYSKLGGVAAIIKSADGGKTWTNTPGENTPPLFSADFGPPAFLTFGKGNTETPQDLAPYVYAVSNDGSWATGNHVRMGRVHRDSIIHKQAWQFFGGLSRKGQPRWVQSPETSTPILTDPGHAGHPTITYNKALKRYILLSFSDAVPHKEEAPLAMMHRWDIASELQMYESRNPWGPWKVFHSERRWGGPDHTNYLPQMPSRWISGNGMNGSVIFSGDYTRDGAHYGFMTQSFN
jgi:hypothetical protein